MEDNDEIETLVLVDLPEEVDMTRPEGLQWSLDQEGILHLKAPQEPLVYQSEDIPMLGTTMILKADTLTPLSAPPQVAPSAVTRSQCRLRLL